MSQTLRAPLHVRSGEKETLSVLGAGVRFLCEAEQTGGRFSVMDNDLPFGAGPPPHRHDWDEAYFIVSGSVDFVVDGQAFRAEAGDFVHTPAGAVHGFSGASETGARLIVFDAPAHAATFFREADRQISGPEEYYRAGEIGAAHGIFFER